MIDAPDFMKKQIIVFSPKDGDKMTYLNDNIVIRDSTGNIKYQATCYQLFAVFVIGNISITSGLIMRARRFNYSIVLMSTNMKVYHIINGPMEGNTYLHKRQYECENLIIAKHIIKNKITNQKKTLSKIRVKTPETKKAIERLNEHSMAVDELNNQDLQSLLGIEGSASRTYFSQVFNNATWKGRKPRVKNDYINSALDIGYTYLFNFVDVLLQLFGFDVYQGVLHRCFYMRKSLVCDIMEPLRPLVDWRVRTAISMEQIKPDDFVQRNHQWVLEYKNNGYYSKLFLEVLLDNKLDIFRYVQSYYRAFMKGKSIEKYPVFEVEE